MTPAQCWHGAGALLHSWTPTAAAQLTAAWRPLLPLLSRLLHLALHLVDLWQLGWQMVAAALVRCCCVHQDAWLGSEPAAARLTAAFTQCLSQSGRHVYDHTTTTHSCKQICRPALIQMGRQPACT